MFDVEDYIKKQIALFQANELLEARERRPGRGKQNNLSYGPYLLISREKGAGGNAVAQRVGKRLGWQVFDNEIVDEIAKEAHVRRQLIESLDEHDRALIEDAISQFLNPQEIGASEYQGYLRQVVLALGHQGDVVIVGRGAQFMLPSQFGLRVRMVAPIEIRSQRIAHKMRLSLEAARVEVEKSDRERVKLIRSHFGHNATDPLNHDLIINTAAMTADAAAEVAITALHRKLGVQIKETSQK